VIDNKELAKYLSKCIQEHYGSYFSNNEYPYPAILEVPTQDDLEFWIQQFRARKCVGHSEWSERFKKNIWVSDYKEDDD